MLTVKDDPHKKIVQESIFPYMLQLATLSVPKDDGKHVVPDEWIKLLGEEAVSSFIDHNKEQRQVIGKKVHNLHVAVFRELICINTYKELCVSISYAYLQLIADGAITETSNQLTVIASKIAEESIEFRDWGDLKSCKKVSGIIIGTLRDNHYFKGESPDGVSSIH